MLVFWRLRPLIGVCLRGLAACRIRASSAPGALIGAPLIVEIPEVGRYFTARGAERDDADERAGERAVLAAARFVRQQRRVEDRPDAAPFAVQGVGELKARLVDGNREADRPFTADRDWGLEREAEAPLGIVALAAQNGQRAPHFFVPNEREAVELRTVVVGGQASRLLKSMRVEVEFGLRAIDEMLLPARDQRLLEPGADRFPRIEA